MYHYISGTVAALDANLAVIDASGVGYALATTTTSQATLAIGKTGKLYVYSVIREDCFDLYGFATLGEKRCFELLLSVSGVGPKAALAILSCNTPADLAMRILTEDETAITAAQGVGKKLAQRVILELRDKMAKSAPELSVGKLSSAKTAAGAATPATEAVAALAVLGYTQGEITLALRGVNVEGKSTQEVIRLALKNMIK